MAKQLASFADLMASSIREATTGTARCPDSGVCGDAGSMTPSPPDVGSGTIVSPWSVWGQSGDRSPPSASLSITAELYDVPCSSVRGTSFGRVALRGEDFFFNIFKLELVTTTTCTGRQEGMGLRWSRLQSLQRSREEQPRRECKLQRSRKLRRAAEEICSSGSLCSGQWACTVERGLSLPLGHHCSASCRCDLRAVEAGPWCEWRLERYRQNGSQAVECGSK